MKQHIRLYKQFINENVLDDILDKISQLGINSLSNHEIKLLKSFSDNSIDAKKEIEKHTNKFKTAKKVIDIIHLKTHHEELEKHIGRYVKFKSTCDEVSLGLLAKLGMIYEIVAVQNHWGYVDGKYVPDKIGYRIAKVGEDNDFGRVGDIDVVEFVNITEEEALSINKAIYKKLDL